MLPENETEKVGKRRPLANDPFFQVFDPNLLESLRSDKRKELWIRQVSEKNDFRKRGKPG